MKKILVFNRTFFSLSETFIQRQVSGLAQNFKVELLAYKFEGEQVTKDYTRHKIYFAQGFLDRIGTLIARRFFLRQLPFSLSTTTFLNSLLAGTKYEMMWVHYGWNALAILQIAIKYNVPLTVSFHGKDASANVKNEAYRKQLPALFTYAQSIILSSPHMVETLGLSAWIHKVHLIPYGIDTADFVPTGPPKIPGGEISILHAGRIAPKKGVPDLIRAFSLLQEKFGNLRLHILGDGKEKYLCEKLIEELQLGERVVLYGAQPQAIVKKLMDQCDIFVLNSRTDDSGDMEGLPNTILEAMSFEKAVVSTRHAGIPQAIQSGENGLLVSERNNAELAGALEVLIKDVDMRLRLGKRARETVLNKFTIETMRAHLLTVLSA